MRKCQSLIRLLYVFSTSNVEQKAFEAGGGKFVAPAQRMVDFSTTKFLVICPTALTCPDSMLLTLKEVLPAFIYQSIAKGFKAFGKKMKGYFTNDAVVVATESRTSSPVRIPRDDETACIIRK